MTRKIGVISTSRADYSIYYGLLKRLSEDAFFDLKVIALGMHCSAVYGKTIEAIKNDGFNVIEGADTLVDGTTKDAISKQMGLTVIEMSKILKSHQFDLIVCLGDRFEMYAAVSAVIPFCIPVAHIHGGELTEGAIDQKFRNALSKLSDYHFVSCEKHRSRVLQMGAAETKVKNVGALGVEVLLSEKILTKGEVEEKYKIDLNKFTLLCTYHPVSVQADKSEYYISEFIKAMESIDAQVIFTRTNADTSGDKIFEKIVAFKHSHPEKVFIFENLGRVGYASFMKHASMMIGNSSSGIIEAASFNLPVVNIGDRQKGREASANVVHSHEDSTSIVKAVDEARKLCGLVFKNIYFAESSSLQIKDFLKDQLTLDYSFVDRDMK